MMSDPQLREAVRTGACKAAGLMLRGALIGGLFALALFFTSESDPF